jgi:hypothetical protein
MSLDAFISGQSVVTPFGDQVPNTNPVERRRVDEYMLNSSISKMLDSSISEDEDVDSSIKLAERTSELIRGYQNFVSEKEYDEEMMLGRVGTKLSSSSTASIVERMNNVGSEFSSSSSTASLRRTQPLLHDWSHNFSSNASNIGPMQKKPMFNDDLHDDSSYQKTYHYHPSYNYKKLKRFAAMGAIVFIVTMIAVIVSSINKGNDTNNSEMNSAALREEQKRTELISSLLEQEEQEQEQGKGNFGGETEGHDLDNDMHDDDNDMMPKEGEDDRNYEKNDASAMIGEEEEVESVHVSTNTFTEVEEDFDVAVGLVKETFVPIVKPGPEYYIENDDHEEESSSSKVELTVDSTYLQLHEQFKPLWLSSKEGWNGGSYADAVAFCNSVRGKQLCPYSVICPNGPGHAVMGGRHALEFKVEGEQYAPILGGDNHWVMVGNTNNNNDDETEDKDSSTSKCMTHRQLEGKNPAWGLNGDRNEVKKHIMCCTVNTI